MDENDFVAPLCNSSASERMLPLTEKKSVSFADVHIHEHFLILGDHPSCSRGPPSTMSWEYISLNPISINDFENNQLQKRSQKEFRTTGDERITMLLQNGHTLSQIMRSMTLVEINKRERLQTMNKCSRPKLLSSAARLIYRLKGKAQKTTRAGAAA
mmetsp:Transcript_14579/g.14777  ORF Transcript_14579/g.14777 Transcript_14579/m.14777 type:complete len:157 (-) Transcript_14579:424-894(-)